MMVDEVSVTMTTTAPVVVVVKVYHIIRVDESVANIKQELFSLDRLFPISEGRGTNYHAQRLLEHEAKVK